MRETAAGERGYAMAALLVGMAVMAIMMSVAMPSWQTAARREREAELVFRGQQYVQAIDLFARRTGGLPPSLDALEAGKFLRKRYKDPITGDDFQPVYLGQVVAGALAQAAQGGRAAAGGVQGRGGAAPVAGGQGAAPIAQPATPFGRAGQLPPVGAQGAGPIVGVVSKSTEEGLRLYNGRGRYNEWLFVATASTRQAGEGTGGQQAPVTPGGRGVRGRGPAPFGRGGPGLPMRGQPLPLPEIPGPLPGRGPGM